LPDDYTKLDLVSSYDELAESKIFMTISISSINLKTFFGEKICNTNP